MKRTTRFAVIGAVVVIVAAAGAAIAQRRTTPPAVGPEVAHHHTQPTSPTAGSEAGTPAARLLEATRAEADRWRTVAAAQRDGFRSIGDADTGFEHYVQWEWLSDDDVLDAGSPESLVYRVDGSARQLVSAMYILPEGTRSGDEPDLGDPRVRWHRHLHLCWEDHRVVGVERHGHCFGGGEPWVTPPMVHVWVVPSGCGPFAGLEALRATGGCGHHHH
jgi:hypothetical protein